MPFISQLSRIVLFFFVALLCSSALAETDAAAYCQIASSGLDSAIEIRKLKKKRKVPCHVRSREEIKKYLLDTIKTKLPPGRLEMEEITYKALGMIPESYNYKDGLIDLYLSQIGGYYDPDKNHFVMASWMPAFLQTTIAVHELTHALQDQHFDLGKFINLKKGSSDSLMARSALVEGDATAVMIDYTRKLAGQTPLAQDSDVRGVMMQNVFSSALMANSGNVPEGLQSMLIFPYTSGLRFAHQLLRTGGYKEIDRAFKDPPLSTEEILHPELYIAGQKGFVEISIDEVRDEDLPAAAKVVHDDTFGEFGIAALLSSFYTNKLTAITAASGWGGDRLAVFQVLNDNGSKETYVRWVTHWDSAADAREFYSTYIGVLEKVYGSSMGSGAVWEGYNEKREVKLTLNKEFVNFQSKQHSG